MEHLNQKLYSLEHQLIETQLKLTNVCEWIHLKFGEDPSIPFGNNESHRPRKHIHVDSAEEVAQFNHPPDPSLLVETHFIKMEPMMDSLSQDTVYGSESLPSTQSGESEYSGSPLIPNPMSSSRIKPLSAYILYSSEARKAAVDANPDKSFGEISKIVGKDWRNKTDAEKNVYAERAREVNRKRGAQIEECVDPDEVPTPSKRPWELTDEDLVTLKRLKLKQGRDWIYECQWSECDLEFEDVVDLIVHCTYQPDGHACLSFVGTNHMDGEFECQWKNCSRIKKGARPFGNLDRLLKHVRDIHILKANGRSVPFYMRSKTIKSRGLLDITEWKRRKWDQTSLAAGSHHHAQAQNLSNPDHFSRTERAGETDFRSFVEETAELMDPLKFDSELSLKQEHVDESGSLREGTEQNHDLSELASTDNEERKGRQRDEIYLVDITDLVPSSKAPCT